MSRGDAAHARTAPGRKQSGRAGSVARRPPPRAARRAQADKLREGGGKAPAASNPLWRRRHVVYGSTRFLGAEAPQVTFGVSRPVDASPVGCVRWRLHDRRARPASPIVVRVNIWQDEVCRVPVTPPQAILGRRGTQPQNTVTETKFRALGRSAGSAARQRG